MIPCSRLKKEMVIVLLRHFKQTQDFTSFPHRSTPEQTQLIFQSITVSQPVRRWLIIINTFQLPIAGYPFCRRVYWGNAGKLISQANYNMICGWARTRNRRITSPMRQPLYQITIKNNQRATENLFLQLLPAPCANFYLCHVWEWKKYTSALFSRGTWELNPAHPQRLSTYQGPELCKNYIVSVEPR